jgi:hypothetical protein
MKKIFSLVVILAAFGASVSAVNPSEYTVFSRLNNESTFNSLARYLNVDYTQADQLKYVFSLTENKLKTAMKADNEVAAEKALRFNLGNAKLVLSEEQYKKYLIVLNVSIYHEREEALLAENN